ncbi:MAG: hypothetical protein M3Y59_24275 [Myxococcota bacterium]|nr:hypothetical protein [Myxococcota bacterium]
MNSASLESTPQRRRAEVSDAVDRKLRAGGAPGIREALGSLSHPERVELITGWLRSSLVQMAFHRWTQPWTGQGVDGPGLLLAISEVGRGLDPRMADLMVWTAARVAHHRQLNRDEPFSSPVPFVWRGAWDQVTRYLDALVERWPDGLDPVTLPVPPVRPRPVEGPARVQVGAVTTPEELVFQAAWALYASGADDEVLQRLVAQTTDVRERLVEVVGAAVQLEGVEEIGGPAGLTARLFPLTPMARALGLERLPQKALVFAPDSDRQALEVAAGIEGFPSLQVGGGRTLREGVRAAARRDCGGVLVTASALGEGDPVELCEAIAKAGWTVIVIGDAPRIGQLREEAERRRLSVVDARR